MTTREIRSGLTETTLFSETDVGLDPIVWLTGKATGDMLLLAHAEDGVIWGQVGKEGLVMPSQSLSAQAELRPVSVLHARLFNEMSEIYLWRTGEDRWRARQVTDGVGAPSEYLDEAQVLWGTTVESTEVVDATSGTGFSRVAEGIQGMRHAVPLLLAEETWKTNRLRLGVRHYLHANDGWRRIVFSRLYGLWTEEDPR